MHSDGNLENAIIDMKKTQLKKSRQWLSIMMMQKHNGKTLPSFANMYKLTSVEDGNDKGSWNSWSIKHEGQVSTMEAYQDAKALHSSVSSGELKPALPTDTDEIPF